MSQLSPNALKIQTALINFGLELKVVELPNTTRTAIDAANAIGCQVAQIVKSLVFKRKYSGKAVFIATSGVNRVNVREIENILGEPIEKADADFVRKQTGFPIGGVPPLGHEHLIETIIDQDLMQLETLWAAAGTPNAVFQLTPDNLVKITSGKIYPVT